MMRRVIPVLLACGVLPLAACGDGGTAGPGQVVINEVVHSALPAGSPDWVELYNLGGTDVDASGWALMDEKDTHSYHLPAGTVLGGGAFLVIEGPGGTGPYVTTFGFGATDSARLFDAGGTAIDHASWVPPDAPAGTSWGRYPDGTGTFATLAAPTAGAANAKPL